MSITAEPLMRAMWNEFPDDVSVYEIYTQFMVGNSLLFAPKVTKPTEILSQMQLQEVNYYLPVESRWFNYQTKVENTKVGQWQTQLFTDSEQALFVRGGSIIPILQHDDCMAILACIQNEITLEVFIDQNGNSYGNLYLDDGESFNYLVDENASASIGFSYEYNTLQSYFFSGNDYTFPESQVVTKILIHGLESRPAVVLAGNVESDYIYDVERKTLMTSGFVLKLGQGKMLEVAWN